jgi:hypothetical protein
MTSRLRETQFYLFGRHKEKTKASEEQNPPAHCPVTAPLFQVSEPWTACLLGPEDPEDMSLRQHTSQGPTNHLMGKP